MTREARRALELAQQAARSTPSGARSRGRSRRMETAHLLLGLLRDGDGPARRLLLDAGVDPVDLERSAEAL
jgi:ATP-dependent Clp protease ATP-binding subunit ClpA